MKKWKKKKTDFSKSVRTKITPPSLLHRPHTYIHTYIHTQPYSICLLDNGFASLFFSPIEIKEKNKKPKRGGVKILGKDFLIFNLIILLNFNKCNKSVLTKYPFFPSSDLLN